MSSAAKGDRRRAGTPVGTARKSSPRPPVAAFPTSHRRPAIMQEPVLVLNATFEPINVTAVRRAMVLLIKGVAQAEEMNHTEVHSASRAMRCPR